jgi:hypothetical protein
MRAQAVRDLDRLLARRHDLERREAATAAFAARMRALRQWQSERLARTHADLRRDPRYARAAEFFLGELYGARDFSVRDRQITHAWRFFKRMLPAAALSALGRAIELDVLTRELDQAVAASLPDAAISEDEYARAYRAAGRRDARERQIALAVAAGEDLDRATRHPLSAALLKAARAPARAAGLAELQGFLERGYAAFRAMPDAGDFLAKIRARETALMNDWFTPGAGADS